MKQGSVVGLPDESIPNPFEVIVIPKHINGHANLPI
jgi:hypothetical protein